MRQAGRHPPLDAASDTREGAAVTVFAGRPKKDWRCLQNGPSATRGK